MGYREEIVTQLYKILEKYNTDARIYYRLADNCKRSALKYFFKKLSLQKRIFCRRVRYEIKELEREIELISGNPFPQIGNNFRKISTEWHTAKNDMMGLITYCYKREKQYLELYKDLLSQTHLGHIREMLLYQKHAVQLALNEIKILETIISVGKTEEKYNHN